MQVSYVFDVIKSRRPIKVKCKKCGNTLKRVLVAEQTINPFNKNKDGSPKSRAVIYAENDVKLKRLERLAKKDGVICAACQ